MKHLSDKQCRLIQFVQLDDDDIILDSEKSQMQDLFELIARFENIQDLSLTSGGSIGESQSGKFTHFCIDSPSVCRVLQNLNLSGNLIKSIQLPPSNQLLRLGLKNNAITSQTALLLSSNKSLGGLIYLDLEYNSIETFADKHFCLFSLQILNLSKNKLLQSQADFILAAAPALSVLNLSYNSCLQWEKCSSLFQAEDLPPRVKQLKMEKCALSAPALQRLMERSTFSSLISLNISRNGIAQIKY